LEANARQGQFKHFSSGVLQRERWKKGVDFVRGEKEWVNWEI